MSERSGLVAVLLAAGLSQRLGLPKQLCRYQGKTLLERALHCLEHPLIEEVLLVTGAAQQECWALAAKSPGAIQEIYHPGYAEGMGSSIRVAGQFLIEQRPQVQAALFCVCDQLHLTSEHIEALINKARGTAGPFRMCASAYAESLGIPAIFPRAAFASLSSLSGQRGAKALLMQEPGILALEFSAGAIDLDTPDDMLRYEVDLPEAYG